MLPGSVPVTLLQARGGELTCYIASALLTVLVVKTALALERRGQRVLRRGLALSLLVFSAMAFLTFLMLRA